MLTICVLLIRFERGANLTVKPKKRIKFPQNIHQSINIFMVIVVSSDMQHICLLVFFPVNQIGSKRKTTAAEI